MKKEKDLKKIKMKRGSILVTVLIIISICTTLVLFMHERSMAAYGTVNTLQNEYQGAIYAMTAAKALEMAFQYDDAAYDSPEDIWNNVPPLPIKNGFLTIYVKPVNSKFPLSALMSDNETVRQRHEDGFTTLMSLLELKDPSVVELRKWINSDNYTTKTRLSEDNGPYSTKAAQLQTLAEIAYIPTFETDYKKISEYASIGDNNKKINLNFASKEVIESYVPELKPYIEEIIKRRESEPLKNVSDLYEIMGTTMQDEYAAILPYIDVKSELFYIKLELNAGNDIIFFHILAKRNGSSVSPIKYIEGTNEEYF